MKLIVMEKETRFLTIDNCIATIIKYSLDSHLHQSREIL